MLKKFFGNKAFYKMVLLIAVPIIIQNGITNFVNLLDNIMVGRLGTEQLSGVGIANQLIFVYTLCLFGGLSGAGIFTAQFFGKGDREGMQYTFTSSCSRRPSSRRWAHACSSPSGRTSSPCSSPRATPLAT